MSKTCLNFGSYDYHGINDIDVYDWNNELISNINGSDESNTLALEHEISKYLGFKNVHVTGSGFATNSLYVNAMTMVNTTVNTIDRVIFTDEYNHYSIIEGCKNTKKVIFKHNNVDDLHKKMMAYPNNDKYVYIEGLYSMHGHLFNIPALIELRKKTQYGI